MELLCWHQWKESGRLTNLPVQYDGGKMEEVMGPEQSCGLWKTHVMGCYV